MCDKAIKEQIYTYIRNYHLKHGYCPSVREIQQADIGISSLSTISRYVRSLIEEGRLERTHTWCRITLPKIDMDTMIS